MRLAYICEGGESLGWGHVGRGRAVLESASEGSALVMGRGYEEIRAWSEQQGVELSLTRWASAAEPLSPTSYDVVIVDHYSLPTEWIARTASIRPTFVIDDWMRTEATAAGFVNPNVGASRDDYPKVQTRDWYLGPHFALLRKEIRDARSVAQTTEPGRRILVTLGGSDPNGCTAQIAKQLVQLPWYEVGGTVTIILGASYAGPEPWTGWPSSVTQGLEVVRQPRDFALRCARADVVVCGAGTTTYELAHLGKAFVPVALVDNQARITREWRRIGMGAGINVSDQSWLRQLCETVTMLLDSPTRRIDVAARVSQLVDGHGVERLIDACSRAAHGEAA